MRTTRGMTMMNLAKGLLALTAVSLLASCGGGGGGGFTGQNPLVVTITAGETSLNTNVLEAAPCTPGECQFTTDIVVTVTRPDGSVVSDGTSVQLSTNNVQVGGVSATVGDTAVAGETATKTTSGGQAVFYFTSGTTGGTATLTASVANEEDGKVVTAQIDIAVDDTTGPVSTLAFTGPYADAIKKGQYSLGDTELQDGTYSRILSVIAKDANGNPPKIGTPIYFALIDAPLTGFPGSGAGTFTVTGTHGDPVEGGFVFTAAGGAFESKGARAGDRLVLHPTPESVNWFHEGVRVVDSFNSADSLNITTGNGPFATGGDTGATVPWTIGRAQYGTILAMAETDEDGKASTVVTYPVTRIGQTAILVAYTADHSVSTVLNTGGAVYLANLGDDGLLLTASTKALAFDSGGSGEVTLCLKDANLVPMSGRTITASVTTLALGSSVTVTPAPLVTGADGCVTATVAGTHVAEDDGDPLTPDTGTGTSKVSFNATDAAAAVEVSVAINDVTP